jgi:hypothetical protein
MKYLQETGEGKTYRIIKIGIISRSRKKVRGNKEEAIVVAYRVVQTVMHHQQLIGDRCLIN